MKGLSAARTALFAASLAPIVGVGACSSWDTGSASIDDVERMCLETVRTFARAAERCGQDYKTAYDFYIRRDANFDCKNVTTIRDEPSLRDKCLPSVTAQPCDSFESGVIDPSCAKQLQRPQ